MNTQKDVNGYSERPKKTTPTNSFFGTIWPPGAPWHEILQKKYFLPITFFSFEIAQKVLEQIWTEQARPIYSKYEFSWRLVLKRGLGELIHNVACTIDNVALHQFQAITPPFPWLRSIFWGILIQSTILTLNIKFCNNWIRNKDFRAI